MKKFTKYFLASISFLLLISCEPRMELDMEQWGDHAFLTNVQVFTLQENEHQLQEYYESGMLTPARRRVIISTGNAVIDQTAFTATVTVPAATNISRAGLIFYHEAEKIEPQDGSPIAGIITDLSLSGNLTYRVISADGTTHDWKVIIVH
ncbi:MAG: hypothetical protein RBS73_05205 [Prolixibacteraceae bacterium]|jgi:hypothetical protein|nr:hypothetical protein [Prolixibacteraceae bacterium]